jgi:hypothetical protein
MEKEIRIPYGPVRETALEELQSSFDTRQLLAAVDQGDLFCAQWREELRNNLLALDAMAHTVINGAPLTVPPGKETLAAMAASLSVAFSEAAQELHVLARLLGPIADLAPD